MVYVDDWNANYRGMIMSHMAADTHEELIEMAKLVGVDEKWIQYKGTNKEHFDICQKKKKLALNNGAIPVSSRQIVQIMQRKVKTPSS